MFKPIALSLLLYNSITVDASGCFPAWTSGGSYNKGSQVSQSKTTNSTAGVLTTTTNNYECISGDGVNSHTSHCPLYDPVGVTTSSAWKDLGACSGTAATTTTTAPTYSAWSGVGCPGEWVEGTEYQPGAVAELDGVVYKCSTVQFINAWCGNPGYKPGDSLYWDIAWTRLGSCSGTMSSTTPDHSGLPDAGGCPNQYDPSAMYVEGDSVAVGGIVLKCRSWPNSLYCNLVAFEPLGQYSEMAWAKVGYCSGTIAPSPPSNVTCPEEYKAASQYRANDKVSVLLDVDRAAIYQCSADIHIAEFCSLFQPGHWSNLGWSYISECNGTVVPSDPFANLDEIAGACPSVYDSSAKYEAKDFVSVAASGAPEKSFVYQCKAWPYGAYCTSGENFAPGTDKGELGWTLKGWCDATVTTTTTTTTPWVGTCEWLNGTTPVTINPWSASVLSTYSAGTRVRVADRVYRCKDWPFYLWCRSSAYEPETSQYWGDAWTYTGKCTAVVTTAATTTTATTATTTVTTATTTA